MELHEALKDIVEKEDITILFEKNIVNILSDYYPGVFRPVSLKKICKYVFSEDYLLLVTGSTSEDINILIPKYTEEIVKKEGFSEEYTTYVLKSLAFAAGLDVDFLDNNKIISERNVTKETSDTPNIPQLHKLLRTMVEEDGVDIFFRKDLIDFISNYFPYVFKPLQIKRVFSYIRNNRFLVYHSIINGTNEDIEKEIQKYTKEIVKEKGYSEKHTLYVLKSIAYAAGLNVELEDIQDDNNVNEKGVQWYGPTPQKKDKNHLFFKDVRIYGDSKSFVEKMCEKGFSIIKQENTESNYMLKGSYAGMECKLMVQISPLTHRTSRVMVIFDDNMYKKWPALKALYFDLKNKLTKKYGKPFSETEAFLPPYKDGCGKEIKLLDEYKGAYQSKYETDGGEIRLGIMSEARVVVGFFDTLGCIELDREFEQASQDDM